MSCHFSPFVDAMLNQYIGDAKSITLIEGTTKMRKIDKMNWVFETYSNVYSTAMMQDVKTVSSAKAARKTLRQKLSGFFAKA
jgi:hypothetical protein